MGYFRTYIYTIFCWVSFVFLMACHTAEDKISSILNKADSLMQTQPDSAFTLLEEIPHPEKLPPSQSAYYGLLLTQAKEKTYVVHTDDSLIRAAVTYYDSTNETALQAKSHYYWACVYLANENTSACVREFLIAISKAKQSKENWIACMAYANLGYLFYYEGLNLKADSCYQQAERLAKQLNDSLQWAWALANQGENYIALGEKKYPIAKSKLDAAVTMSQLIGNKGIEKLTVAALSSLYIRSDSAKLAAHYAKKTLLLSKDKPYYSGFLLMGDAYYQLGEYDSAKVYLTKSLLTTLYHTKVGAYMRLSEIATIEGRLSEAVRLKDSMNCYQDSAQLSQRNVEVVSAIKDMDISQINQKHLRLSDRYSYFLLLIFLILIVFVIFFFYKKKKYRIDILNTEIEREHLKTRLSSELEQKSHEIEKLRCSLRQVEVDNEQAHLLREQIQLLENDKRQILRSLFQHADIYLKIQRIVRYYKRYNDYDERFEQEDWQRLLLSIDPSGKFKECLLGYNQSLTDDEIYLCYLLKMNLSIIDISIIMGCTRDNVYKKRKTILDKLPSYPGSKELIEILDFIYPIL